MADIDKAVKIIFEGEDKASLSAKAVADAMKGVETSTKDAAAASGLWQDEAGKWRTEAGAFASAAEKAAAGIETIGTSTKTSALSLDAFGQKFKDLSGNVQGATEPFKDLTVGALKLEAGLITAGAAMVLLATKTASDFDSQFRQLTTLFDAGAGDVDKYKASILEFASSSTKPVTEITESLQAAVGSGIDYTKSLALVAEAEKLAVATRGDLKGTTEVMVSTLNAYGMKTEESGRLSDIFFQTIKDGKIEMNELSHSLAMVTPLAAASGVSIEEVGAAVATLTASGIPASTAIEYLRSLLTNIVKPSKQAADMAEELGISYNAAALKSKGLAGVLLEVGAAVQGDTGKMSILVGDVGGLTAALALTGPQAAKFAESLKNMGESAGATQAAFEKMTGSVGLETEKAVNAFKVLLISIGTPLLDEFGNIANGIGKIFKELAQSFAQGDLKSVVTFAEDMVKSLGETIQTVAKNLPEALKGADLTGFTKGIQAVADAFGVLFNNIDLTTVDGLRSAIELAGTAFLGLSNFTAGVIESFKPLFDYLVSLAKGAAENAAEFGKMAGNISGIATQMNVFAGVLNTTLIPAFEGLLGLLMVRQGAGVVGALLNLGAAAPAAAAGVTALAAAAIALPGVAAAAGVAAMESASRDSIAAFDAQTLAMQAAGNAAIAASLGFDSIKASTQNSTAGVEGFSSTVGGLKIGLDDIASPLGGFSISMGRLGDSAAVVGTEFGTSLGSNVYKFADAAGLAADKAERLALANRTAVEGTKTAAAIYDEATGKLIGYEQINTKATATVDKATEATAKLTKEQQKAKEAAEKLHLEMEKLASNERIKAMEFKVNLDIARLQEDTKRIEAAFESINNTITSTGEVIGTTLGLFAQVDKFDFEKVQVLKDQLDKENKLREESFALQKKLIEAQIINMEAQTASIMKGDAIIKIDGAGLQPHLEGFMWEVLKGIQMRSNSQGLAMLLGAA